MAGTSGRDLWSEPVAWSVAGWIDAGMNKDFADKLFLGEMFVSFLQAVQRCSTERQFTKIAICAGDRSGPARPLGGHTQNPIAAGFPSYTICQTSEPFHLAWLHVTPRATEREGRDSEADAMTAFSCGIDAIAVFHPRVTSINIEVIPGVLIPKRRT